MEFLDELESLGVDVKEGLGRVMGDEDLYKMMLDMFLTSLQSAPIRPEDFDGTDLTDLIAKVHSLKGTTGNLSITPLFTRYMEALSLLRENRPADAKKLYVELMPIQETIVACIRRHQQ